MTTAQITTTGQADTWVPAQHVDITFTVSCREESPIRAAAAAGQAFEALLDSLTAHEATIARRTTWALTVRPAGHHDPRIGDWVDDGFDAERALRLRLAPVGRAGAVVHAVLQSVAEVRVGTPAFGVPPDHPALPEVRAAAVHRGLAAARQYAAGLDRKLGDVVSLVELADGGGPQPRGGMRYEAMANQMDADDQVSGLVDLSDEDVQLTAAVELVVEVR